MSKAKPFSVAYRDTKNKLAETINTSGLPIDVVVSILKDFLDEAIPAAENGYREDLQKYQEKEKKEETGSD